MKRPRWRKRRGRTYTPRVNRPATSPERGQFITFEGPEGAGKTTQAARLAATLRDRGVEVISTREPGGTVLGERIRDVLLAPARAADPPVDALADALLFNAARRQLVAEVIEPALGVGTTVVCARFADSTRAYQGYGGGLPLGELSRLEAVATGGLKPDRTILLDLPVEIGLARKAPDDRTRFETAYDLAFHQRVRSGFMAMAAAEPARFVVIDASGDPDEIARRVLRSVDALFDADRARSDDRGEPKRPGMRISG
jgi:dTMP kinase